MKHTLLAAPQHTPPRTSWHVLPAPSFLPPPVSSSFLSLTSTKFADLGRLKASRPKLRSGANEHSRSVLYIGREGKGRERDGWCGGVGWCTDKVYGRLAARSRPWLWWHETSHAAWRNTSLASTIIVKTGKIARCASDKKGNILFFQELTQNSLTFPWLFQDYFFPGFPGAYKPCLYLGAISKACWNYLNAYGQGGGREEGQASPPFPAITPSPVEVKVVPARSRDCATV